MTIDKLIYELNKKIKTKIGQFNRIARKMQRNKDNRELMEKEIQKLAVIFQELKPIEMFIRIQNPEYDELFDQLILLQQPQRIKPVLDQSDNIILRSRHD